MSESNSKEQYYGNASAIIERFKQFLRIPTISAEGNAEVNTKAVCWLKNFADAIGLKSEIIEFVPGRPVFVATREGTDPTLPSILLNCHYDVVPVMRDQWTTDPFAAVELENGDIVARGAQDMKCVCTSYLEALLRLARNNKQLTRTIHLSYQPDEEIGGVMGMGYLIKSDLFKSWNVGFALDEGIASDNDAFTVFYGERAVMWLQVKAKGPTGHGSRFIKHTAMEKLIRSVNHFLDYRAEQEKLFESHQGCTHAIAQKLELGDVVTINLTALSGGVTGDGGKTYSLNVIPMDAMAGFDVRIPPSIPLDVIEEKIKEWTAEEGVTYEFVHRTNDSDHKTTSTDREKNPYWGIFHDTCQKIGLDLNLQIFPAGTDSRYLRGLDIPCLGFSPINHSPILLHDHNERLNKNVYLRGIDIYVELITALANMPAQ